MRYFVDVMTGVPSIVFGLFIYIALVVSKVGGSSFAAWKGAVAVTLLMLPIVVRSAEVVLLLVPNSLREAALALGAPRWRVIMRVVLPTSASGLVTGCLLAIARGMGETAPLLFTVSSAMGLTANPNSLMNSLPVQIYNDIHSARGSGPDACVGGGVHAGRDRPDPQPDRPSLAKESLVMNSPDTQEQGADGYVRDRQPVQSRAGQTLAVALTVSSRRPGTRST